MTRDRLVDTLYALAWLFGRDDRKDFLARAGRPPGPSDPFRGSTHLSSILGTLAEDGRDLAARYEIGPLELLAEERDLARDAYLEGVFEKSHARPPQRTSLSVAYVICGVAAVVIYLVF